MMEKYGLVGEKLGHSFSPQIHKALGGYDYALWEVSPEDLPAFFSAREFTALNVTIPYKQAVLPWLDSVSPAARRIGCVNTVVKDGAGRLHGYNTDYYGFIQMARRAGVDPRGKKCLVLGSGGASRTVRACLADMGAAQVVVISRSGPDNYETIGKHADAAVIVNATPVGMYPGNGLSPVDLDVFPRLEGVLDLIYNPARTALLLRAGERNIRRLNGLYMLAAQAKQASELFRGVRIDDGEIARVAGLIAAQTANIVLIGMPGSGKSTVGRLLAEALGRPLIDTDSLIEEKTGCACGEYLRRRGEDAFRALETRAVRQAGMQTGCVVATGGGAVTRRENFDALRQNGVIFHLDRPTDTLSRAGDRPLSATPETLSRLARERAPMYEALRDYAVAGRDAQDAAARIMALFKAHWEVK